MKITNEMIIREFFTRNGYKVIETKDYVVGMIGCFGIKNNHVNIVSTGININGTTNDYTSIESQKFIVECSDSNITERDINNYLYDIRSLFSNNKRFNI